MPDLMTISGLRGMRGLRGLNDELIQISSLRDDLIPESGNIEDAPALMRSVFKQGLPMASEVLMRSLDANQRKFWLGSAVEAVEAAAIAGFNFNKDPKGASNMILAAIVIAAQAADRKKLTVQKAAAAFKRLTKKGRLGRIAALTLLGGKYK